MTKFNVMANQIFTVQNRADWRFGRTYKVLGFDADKSGVIYAVCEWVEEKGYKSSHIFYAQDFA